MIVRYLDLSCAGFYKMLCGGAYTLVQQGWMVEPHGLAFCIIPLCQSFPNANTFSPCVLRVCPSVAKDKSVVNIACHVTTSSNNVSASFSLVLDLRIAQNRGNRTDYYVAIRNASPRLTAIVNAMIGITALGSTPSLGYPSRAIPRGCTVQPPL